MHSKQTTDALLKKIAQATFFSAKLGRSRGDAFQCECYFAAYLSAIRSVALYVRTWLEQEGKIKRRCNKEWGDKMKSWEATLSTHQLEKWRCITHQRNKDIHEEPIVPDRETRDGHWHSKHWRQEHWHPAHWISFEEYSIHDHRSGKAYDLHDVCQTGIEVARLLVSQYETL